MTRDFDFKLTPEQAEHAQKMGHYAKERGKGLHLDQDLELGKMLLVGREEARRLAGNPNVADGRRYADQFFAFKQKYGFPTTKDYTPLYDAAIVCAAHPADVFDIRSALSSGERLRLGIFGLAKRVRDRINTREGGRKKPHKSPAMTTAQKLKEAEGKVADLEEKLAAVDDGYFDPKKYKEEMLVRTIMENCGAAYSHRFYKLFGEALGAADAKAKERRDENLAKGRKAPRARKPKAPPKEPDDRSAAEAAWAGASMIPEPDDDLKKRIDAVVEKVAKKGNGSEG